MRDGPRNGTGPLSVFRECLALRDGPRRFGQDSSCPALLRWSTRNSPVACTGVSPSAPTVSTVFQFLTDSSCRLLRPRNVRKRSGLGSAPFARHYSGYRYFLSSPPGTKMFQFPGFAPSHDGGRPSTCRVAPFGCPRINSCLQIPAAFRSLPRPSSPPDSLGILRSLFLPFSVFAPPFLRSLRCPAASASSQPLRLLRGVRLGRLDLERNFAANCLISEFQSWCIISPFPNSHLYSLRESLPI